jgi:hypothetical protein
VVPNDLPRPLGRWFKTPGDIADAEWVTMYLPDDES